MLVALMVECRWSRTSQWILGEFVCLSFVVDYNLRFEPYCGRAASVFHRCGPVYMARPVSGRLVSCAPGATVSQTAYNQHPVPLTSKRPSLCTRLRSKRRRQDWIRRRSDRHTEVLADRLWLLSRIRYGVGQSASLYGSYARRFLRIEPRPGWSMQRSFSFAMD